MRDDAVIALNPGPDGAVALYAWPRRPGETADHPTTVPANATRIATVVDVDGGTAPEPSAELVVHLYRDGSVSIANAGR